MGSQSLGSSLLGHRGRLFRIPTASANTVLRVSLVTRACGWPKTAFIVLRTLLIRRSHTPDMWLAVGGWKCHFLRGWQCHSTSFSCRDLRIISWSNCWMASVISPCSSKVSVIVAPDLFGSTMNADKMSQCLDEGVCLQRSYILHMYCSEVKQTKIQPYTFSVACPRFT